MFAGEVIEFVYFEDVNRGVPFHPHYVLPPLLSLPGTRRMISSTQRAQQLHNAIMGGVDGMPKILCNALLIMLILNTCARSIIC